MDIILVLNCGSSSLKYQLISMKDESIKCKGVVERIGIDGSNLTHKVVGKENYVIEKKIKNHNEAVNLVFEALTDKEHGVINSLDDIYAIGHRVLHGGNKFTTSTIINDEVKATIRQYFDLGPLHNPANLMGIEACEKHAPHKKNVAVFDTTFGMTLEERAYLYAIPYEYYEKYNIRKYGFHGTSHKFVANETISFGKLKEDAKVIVCHLGNGASLSASIGGKCFDTSMGFTPLEGLVMGTRSGALDPTIISYLCKKDNKSVEDIIDILNKKSGLYGLSNYLSSDFRDLYESANEGNVDAMRALKVMKYRLIKFVGSYIAAMNGCDAIAFTAGIGENNKELRKEICDNLTFLGVKIDEERNKAFGKNTLISTDDSKIKVFLIPTNEELMIARETLKLIK